MGASRWNSTPNEFVNWMWENDSSFDESLFLPSLFSRGNSNKEGKSKSESDSPDSAQLPEFLPILPSTAALVSIDIIWHKAHSGLAIIWGNTRVPLTHSWLAQTMCERLTACLLLLCYTHHDVISNGASHASLRVAHSPDLSMDHGRPGDRPGV